MAKKKRKATGTISNRRASFDYNLGDEFVVGVVLNGRETKNLRLGHGNLRGAYVTIKGNELWLINATINGSRGIPIEPEEVTQARKLLAKRREINQLMAAKQQGKTIIPTDILIKGRYIKVRIKVGTGKKHYDKRQTLKKRSDELAARRAMKNF